MSLRRFTNPKNLRALGRPLLGRFFAKFEAALKAAGVKLPPESADEGKYFDALAKVFMSPNELPGEMIDALYAVVEMANDSGQERLLNAVKEKKLDLGLDGQTSHMDYAMRVWLADGDLLMAKHGEQRLLNVASYQYFGTKMAVGSRLPFKRPAKAAVDLVRDEVDKWCADNNRGSETARVRIEEMDGEWWIPIQHGGTFKRESKVDKRKVETLHFRPGQDALVVYCPVRDEIRVHADTGGERKLYQEKFGTCLRGDAEYFSEKKAYWLEPLRVDVEKALSVEGISAIDRIVLQGLEVGYGGEFDDTVTYKSDDLLASAAERTKKKGKLVRAVPERGRLIRATFEFHFGNSKPRMVHVRPPNVLRLGRACDARAVHEWLTKRGFRDAPATGKG